MQRGLFIMIEGTDGSGKGTQTDILVDRLRKEKVEVEQISFPQYGEPSAFLVEEYLNGKYGSAEEVGPYKASILYATDRFAAAPKIKQWLKEGKIVIANRYVASNMGHQGGKIKDIDERKKYFDWNYNLEYEILEIPRPTVNLILHVTPEISQQLVDKKEEREYLKGKKRDIHEDDLNHLADAEQAYVEIAKTYPEFKLIECVEDDSILPPEQIHAIIWEEIKKYL
ncbi:MAG: thymidylate kinase [Candidatus Magasanikbacteria bacterium]|jgi:dTMP kinase|nr:thymidylate kinase [Candidatus Magasanikbacteria bacterium]MBT4315161.1 thymidylate kinase [Candidatus Magasanikbacteria bacterium]MBT4547383.1 thymidylate kinase [Candidatus Magasanikbacteria bacterium]MBT6819082.1 thymidylate kinase [Candidatus Magasanikbacteria bacterium]